MKTMTASVVAGRPIPGGDIPKTSPLTATEKKHAVRLMRINHAGEIAAQGLYHGHTLCARSQETMHYMQKNAHEESDHLAWCRQRIHELGGNISIFAPFWYGGSLCIGMLAGFAGDRWSLGFVKETEDQVVAHLNSHLNQLSPNDKRTTAIIKQIAADEAEHAGSANRAGSHELPDLIKHAMRLSAKVMTKTAYYL